MRLTYTNIKKAHFRNIGKAGQFQDTTLLEDFQYSLGIRYQLIWGKLSTYLNQDTLTASTVAAQQYYYYPVGTVGIDSATVIIGSFRYTITPIYSQYTWNMLNAMTYQPTAIPQFIFPRKDDFGIWPIPQDVYTIEFNRYSRDRNLLVDDYIDGTVTLTAGSTTITGIGTVFTPAMVGRWFTVNQTSVPGQGYWYRIGSFSSVTSMELETVWAAANATSVNYRIGESPEMPEEGHVMLPNGTASDFYAGLRNDTDKATLWNNAFWTGDMNNAVRDLDNKNVSGGLIGMLRSYKDRERDAIVMRDPNIISPVYKIFAQSITE